MKRRLDDTAGIALVEVMMAALVIGVGLGATFNLMNVATRQESALGRRAIIERLSEEMLTTLMNEGAINNEGRIEGAFDPPYNAYHWIASVQGVPTEAPHLEVTFRVIDVEKKETLYRLTTWVLRDG